MIFIWPWNENAWTKQKQQTSGNRKIWLVYRTLRWKNFMSENFLEINWNQFDVILEHDNVFSILGFSLAGKRRGRNLIVSSISWWNKITNTYRNHFSRSYENLATKGHVWYTIIYYLLLSIFILISWIFLFYWNHFVLENFYSQAHFMMASRK